MIYTLCLGIFGLLCNSATFFFKFKSDEKPDRKAIIDQHKKQLVGKEETIEEPEYWYWKKYDFVIKIIFIEHFYN